MKKRLIIIVFLFLVLVSIGVMAQDDTSPCGFWGTLFGSCRENAVVGEAG